MTPNLTDAEKVVLEATRSAWLSWTALDEKHPDDDDEFKFHIHALQNMIAWRVARRVDPAEWWVPKQEAER